MATLPSAFTIHGSDIRVGDMVLVKSKGWRRVTAVSSPFGEALSVVYDGGMDAVGLAEELSVLRATLPMENC